MNNERQTSKLSPAGPAGPEPEPVRTRLPGAQRFFYMGGAVALAIGALVVGKAVLMPLASAALLAFVLDPLVEQLRRWRVPQVAAVTLVVTLALAVLSATTALMAQQLIAVSRDLPTYHSTIQNKLKALRGLTDRSPVVADASRMVGIIESGLADTKPATRSAARTPVVLASEPVSPLRAAGDWAEPVLVPLVTTGFVLVLVAYLLAQRRELRDRLVRLTGGDIHHMTDVLDDAARRVSRYLGAHLLVNVGYGLPMALGLWWIGVPGAVLWGLLAALLRFVPYLGPAIGALFPLTMAFAVDPGWSMVMWTLALVLTLELLSNNIVEPLAYGTSTGVSPVAVLVSAAFWGLLWGPVGLVLATPLTVCLVVLGQHLGSLRFLHVMLGSGPAFDGPTRLYQRLIAGDTDEALASSRHEAAADLGAFYDRTALPMLQLAATAEHASPAQRHRVLRGTAQLLETLREQQPPPAAPGGPTVLCVGARNELDSLSAEMLAHVLSLQGQAAQALSAVRLGPEQLASLDLRGVACVVLCSFHDEPQTQARLLARRLRRRRSGLHVVLAAWRADAGLRWPGAAEALGVDALATSLLEAAGRVPLPDTTAQAPLPPLPPGPAALQPALHEHLARGAQRALEVFGTPTASVCWRAADGSLQRAGAGSSAWALGGHTPAPLPGSPLAHVLEAGEPLAVVDLARDTRFAGALPEGAEAGGALAAWPLHGRQGQTLGVLALHDTQPRPFSSDELRLLGAMAAELAPVLEQAAEAAAAEQAAAHAEAAASAPSYPPQRPAPAAGAPCAA